MINHRPHVKSYVVLLTDCVAHPGQVFSKQLPNYLFVVRNSYALNKPHPLGLTLSDAPTPQDLRSAVQGA